MLKQVVDGFSYNTTLRYLPCRYFPNALASLDVLRRAANFRARWFVSPADITVPIQPFDTLYDQWQVPGGSRLWGYNFVSVSEITPASTIPIPGVATHVAVQAVDSCSGIPLFQDVANGGGCSSNFTARCLPILLTKPRVFLEPGIVNVEVANLTANTITCQLLAMFAEPCRLIDEKEREIEWNLMQGKGIPR